MTHYQLLSNYFLQGYPKALYVDAWERVIARVSCRGYYQAINVFEEDRRERPDFYTTINQENPVRAALEPEQDESGDGTTGPAGTADTCARGPGPSPR